MGSQVCSALMQEGGVRISGVFSPQGVSVLALSMSTLFSQAGAAEGGVKLLKRGLGKLPRGHGVQKRNGGALVGGDVGLRIGF
ncbi:hypothetical protein EC915_103424 [Pseudomonas sp. LP_7_YM]|nr:hypothetical protein EC915_103424 [Pseudomonas sp. LP_7_YM]